MVTSRHRSGQIVSSGPFVLTSWQHETSLTLEKNPLYWDVDAVALERIEISPIPTPMQLWASTKLVSSFMDVSTDFLPMYRNTPGFGPFPWLVAFIEFNPNVEF